MTIRKLAVAAIFLAASLVPEALAGSIEPTWAEMVVTAYQAVNPWTGEPAVITQSQPYTGNGFYAASTASQYGPGTNYVSLIDFQQSHGTVTLDVTLAYRGAPGIGINVPITLDVLAYPSSPAPPNLTAPPTGTLLEQITVTPGIPLDVDISPGSAGAECFLIQIDPGGPLTVGSPTVEGTVDPAGGSVPEPESVVMMVAAIVAGIVMTRRRAP